MGAMFANFHCERVWHLREMFQGYSIVYYHFANSGNVS